MKTKLTFTLTLLLAAGICALEANAATIVLRSGVTVKGKLTDKTDDEITIQDPDTKQMRVIKTVFIKDLVLEPDEQKLVEKLEKKKKKKEAAVADESNILSIITPSIGLMPGIGLPVGKIAEKVQLGYGAYLFTDVGIPKMPEIFMMRFGLSVGFMYHPTSGAESTSTIMMIPIVAYTKLQFITSVGVRPYIKIGGGITPVMGGGTSMDPTLAVGLGLGYVNKKIPYMEFFLEAGMLMCFESLNGMFININLGFAYRFGAPPVTTDIKLIPKK